MSPDPSGDHGSRDEREAPREREAERLEAFSDGVMAVIITIMVLELADPAKPTVSAALKTLPGLLVYMLSFSFIGIYWVNHHHLLRATDRISGAVMWANLNLLFWLSLIPLMTRWMSEFYRSHLPASLYGVVCFLAAIAYSILVRAIITANGTDTSVARAVGSDRKGYYSLVLYGLGVGLAWVSPFISYVAYAAVSLMWFIPDRRFDRRSFRGQ